MPHHRFDLEVLMQALNDSLAEVWPDVPDEKRAQAAESLRDRLAVYAEHTPEEDMPTARQVADAFLGI